LQQMFSQQNSLYSSRSDTTTIVHDSSGAEWLTVRPGADLKLSLPDLMTLAGVFSLDAVEPMAGTNHMPGASGSLSQGPTLRLSGLELGVTLDCTQGAVRHGLGRSCLLQASPSLGKWVVSTIRGGQGDVGIRKIHGVRIKVSVIGSELLWNWSSLFVNIASSLVYLDLPWRLVFIVAIRLCGHISRIYRSLIYQRFDIAAESASMAMRLIEIEAAFNMLESTHCSKDGQGYILKDDLRMSLSHVMQRREHELDDDEVRNMAHFCASAVVKSFGTGSEANKVEGWIEKLSQSFEFLQNISGDLQEALGCTKVKPWADTPQIYLDSFAAACTSADPMSFDNLVKLFDRDRKLGFMERIFTPLSLQMSSRSQAVASEPKVCRHSTKQAAVLDHLTQSESVQQKLAGEVNQLLQAKIDVLDHLEELNRKQTELCTRVDKMERLVHGIVPNTVEKKEPPCVTTADMQPEPELLQDKYAEDVAVLVQGLKEQLLHLKALSLLSWKDNVEQRLNNIETEFLWLRQHNARYVETKGKLHPRLLHDHQQPECAPEQVLRSKSHGGLGILEHTPTLKSTASNHSPNQSPPVIWANSLQPAGTDSNKVAELAADALVRF